MMNKGMMKLLEKYGEVIENMHREFNYGWDYWIHLKNGYICPDMECGTIHEYNLKDCENMLKTVITIEEYEKQLLKKRGI